MMILNINVKNIFITRSRADIYKNITPDYYGYRDDDDGVLIPKEDLKEVKLIY